MTSVDLSKKNVSIFIFPNNEQYCDGYLCEVYSDLLANMDIHLVGIGMSNVMGYTGFRCGFILLVVSAFFCSFDLSLSRM